MDPMSVHTSASQTPEERLRCLMAIASNVELSPGLSIQQYLRALRSMLQMIDVHMAENRRQSAYVLASKFLTLFVELLPRHKEFGQIGPSDLAVWKNRCRVTFKKAEDLKAKLHTQFTAEHEEYLREQAAIAEATVPQPEILDKVDEFADLPEPPKTPPLIREQRRAPVESRHTWHPRSYSPIPGYPKLDDLDNSSGENDVNNRLTTNIPPTIDRSSKPQTHSTPHGWLPVRMSLQLAHRFLQLAESNTMANRETCGSLCGRLVNGEYRITDVVILKQSGTADSCTTHNEEELFDYMESRNLIVLGWIHTHPSQTAFLSSVDQHSQLSYQIMLPESVAIVCAPKFNDIAVFSLNPVYGMSVVRQCKQTGFHPHPNAAPIYEPSPHVIDDPQVPFTVTDLR